jgi:hypothetical protein
MSPEVTFPAIPGRLRPLWFAVGDIVVQEFRKRDDPAVRCAAILDRMRGAFENPNDQDLWLAIERFGDDVRGMHAALLAVAEQCSDPATVRMIAQKLGIEVDRG